MAEYVEVPKSLYNWIPQDDPLRITKYCQIRYWWRAFSDVYHNCNLDTLVGILSSEDCWRRVDNLHGVKLDGQILGKRLFTAPFKYSFVNKFKLASRHCLVDCMLALVKESKETESFEDICYAKFLRSDTLGNFWLHLIENRISNLKPSYLHVFEYAFQCAVDMKQRLAMEFFWNKIKESPENEISSQRKEDIIVNCAIHAAYTYHNRPEIFEFVFSQIRPEKYSEFLEMEFRRNDCCKSVLTLLKALCFDEFKALFDCLMPNQMSVQFYCFCIQRLGMNYLYGRYMESAVSAFTHMWKRTGFDEHRSIVYSMLAVSAVFQGDFLVPLFLKGYTHLVWTILDKASREYIKEYMNSKNSDHIVYLLLEMKDYNTLYKFLTYRAIV